ncbi:hypothetical protein EE612_055971, partial [Oryza sativa]
EMSVLILDIWLEVLCQILIFLLQLH